MPPPFRCPRPIYSFEGFEAPVARRLAKQWRRREKGPGKREGIRWDRPSERSSCLGLLKQARF